ncbi:hypothetical protein AURDEDRAFT_162144 [Auricularia subglabra TFB-10046 SS5]|nr:hypothetical protein AURDEDRAFT_162144 [Auricularia subglabra TFB-10046 SS5]
MRLRSLVLTAVAVAVPAQAFTAWSGDHCNGDKGAKVACDGACHSFAAGRHSFNADFNVGLQSLAAFRLRMSYSMLNRCVALWTSTNCQGQRFNYSLSGAAGSQCTNVNTGTNILSFACWVGFLHQTVLISPPNKPSYDSKIYNAIPVKFYLFRAAIHRATCQNNRPVVNLKARNMSQSSPPPTALTLAPSDLSSGASQGLREALHANIDSLALLNDQLAVARGTEKRASDVLVSATAACEMAKLHVHEVEQRIATLSSSTQRIRNSLHTLSHFPFELLSLIFVWANTDDADDEYDERGLFPREINIERLKLPWRLGAVCSRWRTVVLRSPAVWSYIAIPEYGHSTVHFGPGKPIPLRNTDRSFFPHFKLLLQRSSRASLDVVICVGHVFGRPHRSYESLACDESKFIHDLLGVLSLHLGRIRTLHIDGRGYEPMRHDAIRQIAPEHLITSVQQKFVDLLRAPTPRLVDLRLRFPEDPQPFWHGFPETPLPMLLPQAPELRSLSVCHAPIALKGTHPGLPSLRQLKLDIHAMHGVALSDTLWATPALEELTLSIRNKLPVEDCPIQLPDLNALRVLIISTPATFELLEDGARYCPNLTSIALSGLSDMSFTPPLSRRLASLALSDCEDLETHVMLLRALENLEVVDLSHCTMQDDVFFAAFCDAETPMWPKLAVLRLWRVQMKTVDQDGILQFMRRRCSRENQARWKLTEKNPPADAYPRPLAVLHSDRTSVPMWVLVQIKSLFPDPEDSETQVAGPEHRASDSK